MKGCVIDMIYKINSINEMFNDYSINNVVKINILNSNILNEDTEHISNTKITKGRNTYISVDGDGSSFRNWGADPYFKFFVGRYPDPDKADFICRIRFDRAEYVYPIHGKKRKMWYLNSKERKILMDILKSHIVNDDKMGPIQMWEWMNYQLRLCIDKYKDRYIESGAKILTYYEMPNYINIE